MPSSIKERPWAELCVLRGAPPHRLTFSAGAPDRHVLGSGESASLRFAAPNVAPRHLHLVWDGQHAWLEDPLRLGRTIINGRTLNEWVRVGHTAIVVFGSVCLGIRSEGGDELSPRLPSAVPRSPNFDALERAHLVHSGALRRRDTLRLPALKTASG
jgi:hypothetical protein